MSWAEGSCAGGVLIEALVLQHQGVRKVTIEAEVGCVMQVTVEHYLHEEQLDALAVALPRLRSQMRVLDVPLTISKPQSELVEVINLLRDALDEEALGCTGCAVMKRALRILTGE